MAHLELIYLLKIVIFQSYVSLPEGILKIREHRWTQPESVEIC